ncbi:TetR family transcriptional regulator [Aliihoeflea aestuarii]|nr:TetR family transcriptional regulator [Aliihoeflea aestuarii]
MGELLSAGELPSTMSELAKAAGMSTATAYRHFQSLEEVAQAYLIRTMTTLRDFSVERSETGTELLRVISRYWINIVQEHGGVLVQIRSRRGFYDRLQQRVVSTELGFEARRRALVGVLAEHGLPASMLDDAAMLYNTMFDPRDIIDLITLRGLKPDSAAQVLVSAFIGALQGWHLGLATPSTHQNQR